MCPMEIENAKKKEEYGEVLPRYLNCGFNIETWHLDKRNSKLKPSHLYHINQRPMALKYNNCQYCKIYRMKKRWIKTK